MFKCACYLRVSTEDQARKATPISSQLSEIRQWARKNNATILEKWIIKDEGVSGSTDNRPGFQKLINATENGSPFNAILVFDRDRFFRNFEEEIYYEVVLRKRGVGLISITENQDPQLVKYIKMIVAEETRKQGIKHTIRGMKERARMGLWNGGAAPYGLRRENDTLVPEAGEDRIVRDIFQWYYEGDGYLAIVERLSKKRILAPGKSGKHGGRPCRTKSGWSKSTIYYILKNPVYKGCLVWNKKSKKGKRHPKEEWIIKENAIEPIVEPRLFDEVQKMLAVRKKRYYESNPGGRKPSGKYLLSSVMVCANCGHHYAGHTYGGYSAAKNGKKRYYWCSGFKTKGRYFCDWFPIDAEWIETRLFSEIYTRLSSPNIIPIIVDEFNKRVQSPDERVVARKKEIKQEISKTEVELTKIVDFVKNSDRAPQSLVNEIVVLEDKKEQLLAEEEELKFLENPRKEITEDEIKAVLKDLEDLLSESATPAEKIKLVEKFIPEIKIYAREKAVAKLSLSPTNIPKCWWRYPALTN